MSQPHSRYIQHRIGWSSFSGWSAFFLFSISVGFILSWSNCSHNQSDQPWGQRYIPPPTIYEHEVLAGFPKIETPNNNPTTNEGILLGRKLFFDPILSVDSTLSCSFCHLPEKNFTDRLAKSRGVGGVKGKRSSPTLLNVGFLRNGLFWDGRASSLEEQALLPVEDPLEMQASWPEIEHRLRIHFRYPLLFRKAFGISKPEELTRELVVKAIAQFERTLVSGQSKYDRVQMGRDSFTHDEAMGYDLFFDVTPEVKDAECGNCHNEPLFTNHKFANNALSNVPDINAFPDKGLGAITGDPHDNGKFKIPTLRNIALTDPYMHDGRFATLSEVIDHYNSGGHPSPTVHPLIRPLGLTPEEKKQLLAFLHTLTDTSFAQNKAFQNPFLK